MIWGWSDSGAGGFGKGSSFLAQGRTSPRAKRCGALDDDKDDCDGGEDAEMEPIVAGKTAQKAIEQNTTHERHCRIKFWGYILWVLDVQQDHAAAIISPKSKHRVDDMCRDVHKDDISLIISLEEVEA